MVAQAPEDEELQRNAPRSPDGGQHQQQQQQQQQQKRNELSAYRGLMYSSAAKRGKCRRSRETALAQLASRLQLGSKASSREEEEEVGRCGCAFVKDVMCLCACHYY